MYIGPIMLVHVFRKFGAIGRSDPSADGRPIGGCAARQARGPSADGSEPSADRWLETWTHSKY